MLLYHLDTTEAEPTPIWESHAVVAREQNLTKPATNEPAGWTLAKVRGYHEGTACLCFVLGKDVVADVDALVTDKDSRPRDERAGIELRLPAERATRAGRCV